MRETIPDRAVVLGEYILDTGATVRATAKVFKISKSTVQTEVAIMKVLFFYIFIVCYTPINYK